MKRKLVKIVAAAVAVVVMISSFSALLVLAEEVPSGPGSVGFPRKVKNPDWFTEPVNLVNGWGLDEMIEETDLYCLDRPYYRELAYCLEIGTDIKAPGTLEDTELDYKSPLDSYNPQTTIWERLAERNDLLNADELRDLLGRVLYYGYKHDGSCMTNWDSESELNEKFAYAYATQLLVWETVVGERDKNFNHRHVSTYNRVLDVMRNSLPIRQTIMDYYDNIVWEVQGDADIPNSTFYKVDEAQESVYEMQYSNGKFILEIKDSRFEGYEQVNSSETPGVTCEYKNGKLIITSNRPFADIATIKLEKTFEIGSVVLYTDGIHEAGNGKQDLITYVDYEYEKEDFTYYTKTCYLSVECPHHHVFIPYTYRPTCSEQGYTVWKCACGIWTSEDPVTGKDSHVPATGHNFDDSVWVTSIKATCTQNGESVQFCGDCGAVIGKKTLPATGHDSGVWIVDIEATSVQDGTKVLCCTKCGDIIDTATFAYHDHVYGYTKLIRNAYCKENGLEGKFCSECNTCYEYSEIPAAGHSTEEETIWVVSSQAECASKGEYAGYCSDCGIAVRTKEIPADGHGDVYYTTTVNPCCEYEGEEVGICTSCNEILATNVIPAKGHDEGTWITSREATCFAYGEEARICTECNFAIETKSIPAEGHDGGAWKIDFDATAEHEGQLSRRCTKCGYVLETKTFARHLHTEGYRLVLIEPTCTKEGQEGIYCSLCGGEYATEDIPAYEHDYSEVYMNTDGTHSRSCSACHYVEKASCSYEVTTVPADCVNYGYSEYLCTVCGYSFTSDFVDAFGHDMSSFVDDANAVTHTSKCSRCDYEETFIHSWSEWRLIEKKPLEEIYERRCEVCGSLQTSVVTVCDDPHAHTMERFEALSPTCTEDGREEYYHCTDPECNKYYSDLFGENEIEKDSWIIPAHGHNYVLVYEKSPTEAEEGYKYFECTYESSHSYTEEEEPLCDHLCHSDKWYYRMIWFFVRSVSIIFNADPYCDCGIRHF